MAKSLEDYNEIILTINALKFIAFDKEYFKIEDSVVI